MKDVTHITEKDCRQLRHKFKDEVTLRFAKLEEEVAEAPGKCQDKCKYRDDVILTKQTVNTIKKDLDEIKEGQKIFIQALDGKVSWFVFSAVATIVVGILSWLMYQDFIMSTKQSSLPYEVADIVLDKLNDSYNIK